MPHRHPDDADAAVASELDPVTLPIAATTAGLRRQVSRAVKEPSETALSVLPFDARYQRLELLGRGGVGSVRLCSDEQIGRRVALKQLRPELDHGPEVEERFVREARIQGQLEHPAVAPVYDLGVDETGRPFFTMRRVHGETLRTLALAEEEAYSQRKLLNVFATVCRAVDYAHRRGVVHRDLKPDNVMLGAFGEVYVLDWGLAKLRDDERDDAIVASARDGRSTIDLSVTAVAGLETEAGLILGTPGYVAPERLRDPLADAVAGDIYALGAILFELLAGSRLHRGSTVGDLLASTLSPTVPRAAARAPQRDIAPELDDLCQRALAVDPAARFESAGALADAVEAYLDGERDEAQRRELAAIHAAAAEASMASDEEDGSGRQRAMRELGRALALDAGNDQAKDLLVRLLSRPPKTLPPEVQAQLIAADEALNRQVARIASHVFATALLFLPLFLLLEVRRWTGLSLYFGLTATCSLLAAHVARRGAGKQWLVLLTMVLSNIAFASLSVIAGALIIVPPVVVINAIAYTLLLRGWGRLAAVLGGCLAVIVPLLLELFGLFGQLYRFGNGAMTIAPRAMPLDGTMLAILGGAAMIFCVAVGALVVAQVRDILAQRERQVALYAWHLREFFPTQDQRRR